MPGTDGPARRSSRPTVITQTAFRSKNDLLLSDAERFFELREARFVAGAAGTRRVAPVAALFAHAADCGRF